MKQIEISLTGCHNIYFWKVFEKLSNFFDIYLGRKIYRPLDMKPSTRGCSPFYSATCCVGDPVPRETPKQVWKHKLCFVIRMDFVFSCSTKNTIFEYFLTLQ
jgi:hypothetical protein